MEYTEFLQCCKTLNGNEINKNWNGSLYLPSCTCSSSSKVAQSCLDYPFDLSSFSNIEVPKLINLCRYIEAKCDSNT